MTTLANMKTNQQIAYEVLMGKWGNGADRKNRLTKAGYNYNAVQTIVNALVAGKTIEPEIDTNSIKIIGTKYMDIEVDLSEYKGINLTFVCGGEEDAKSDT